MSIELLKKCGKTSVYKKDTIICREGEVGHSMYIVLDGVVAVNINSFSNNAQSLCYLQPGSFFGEMSLLEKKPRSATVSTCSDNVVILEIEEKDFPELLQEETAIAYHLLCTLNQRLNNMLERIEKENKKFVYKYRKNANYMVIQKMDKKSFETIAHENANYVWTLLKYLSVCLNGVNSVYLNLAEK